MPDRPGTTIEIAAYEHLEEITRQRDVLAEAVLFVAEGMCSGLDHECRPDDEEVCEVCTCRHALAATGDLPCTFRLPDGSRCQRGLGHQGDHEHHVDGGGELEPFEDHAQADDLEWAEPSPWRCESCGAARATVLPSGRFACPECGWVDCVELDQ